MILIFAMLLDAIVGEPRWLWSRVPHPAVLMGKCVAYIDHRFNRGDRQRIAGVWSFGGLVIAFATLGWLLTLVPGQVIDLVILAVLLAQRSLVQHITAVADGLRLSLGDGRRAVAMIVSRDTRVMDQSAVARSAIESGSENMSDGVIAPLFWFAIAGLPGLLVYKITNTADSMIGYRTPKHAEFGWAAAKFDDLLNLIPARLTAALIWLPRRRGTWSDISRDAGLHRSPNAGWPEAAMAYAHNIALAGPRSYDGQMTPFPYVNPDGRTDLGPSDIDATVGSLWQAWGIALGAAVVVALI